LNFSDGKRLVLGNAAEASLMLQWGIKPNVAIYNAFITVCAKTGQFDSAWHLVCGDKPVMAPHLLLKANQITCMNLLTACAETERYAEAKSLVLGDTDTASLMQQWSIKPDDAIYNAFITVCAKTGQFDSAWQLVCGDKLVMAPHLPLKANQITCMNLLAACAEMERYAEATSLVLGDGATASLMQQWGIKLNVAIYSAFITVCAKTGQFDSAWQLVCGDKPVMAPHLPLKADSITCMNLLTACAETGRYAEAKSLVLGDGDTATATASLMQQWGIKPNVAIYNAFITVCAKTGQFDSAWQLVCGDKPVMAPHFPLKANQITCMNLLAACAEAGRYAEAKLLVLDNGDTASLMQQWDIMPNVAIYSAFITVCAKTSQFDSAWQLVCGDKPVMAPHFPLKANQITCMNLLAACAEAGRYAAAKLLVLDNGDTASLMQQWDIMPNVAIYSAFITVCAKTGQFDSAWQLVCGDKPVMAPHLPLKADSITCTNLLTACAEAGRYTEAKSLVLGDTATASLMQQWDIKPNVAIYSAFIAVCVKTGQFDSAWQLVCGDKPVMAPHLPLKADLITCMNLLAACAEMERFTEAKSLVLGDGDTATASLMQKWGIKPNVAIYNAFITVCVETGQFDSAWQLVCGDKPVMAPHLPLKANQITCTNLLTACAEAGRYAEAKLLVLGDTTTASLMQQWKIKPDVAVYSTFIKVCAKTSQFDSAWQLVCGDKPVMAPHLPLKADSITCMNLLAACAEMERFTEAKSLVLGDGTTTTASLMQQWGIKPDVAIYSAFITVCAKTSQFDSAWQLVCGDKPVMAPHLPLKANQITCMNLLTACAEAGRYAEAKSLVLGDTATATTKATASLMQQWGIKPDIAIYNAFITVCAKTSQFDSAWQLVCGDKLVMASHLSLKANQITCINLLTACAEAGRYAEAKSLVLGDVDTTTPSLMQQWGIKPDVAIYNAFTKVCINAKEFDIGIWYLEKIMNECNMSTPSQIHAQLAPLEKDNFASLIDKGITQGIYKKNVGLMNHCIDLHMDKIFEEHSGNGTHIRGVPLAFAKLLFCYHKKNNEPNIKSIITGYHGNNTLKNGMISFLKDEFGLEFIEDKFNSGVIVLSESTH
ncbi:hypothetical protein D5R81_15295, partial [Parashewanella spongiae]